MPRYVPEDSLKSPRFTGIPTFARLPYVRTLDDVDLAVIGVPFDTATTYRTGGQVRPERGAGSVCHDPALQPRAGRESVRDPLLRRLRRHRDRAGVHRAVLWRDRAATCSRSSRRASSRCSSAATTPARCRTCGRPGRRGPVAVIMFDSHTDAWDNHFGEKYTHGTWMRRAIEEGPGRRRALDRGRPARPALRLRRLDLAVGRTGPGLRSLPRADARRRRRGCARIRARVGDRQAFISFDIDVVDPAFAPGTGTPEAGGLSSHQALELIRGLHGIDFIGFDVVEVIPSYDPAGVTATLAANLAFEMMSLSAVRRRGRV